MELEDGEIPEPIPGTSSRVDGKLRQTPSPSQRRTRSRSPRRSSHSRSPRRRNRSRSRSRSRSPRRRSPRGEDRAARLSSLRQQIEWYFSEANLKKDKFLLSQMDKVEDYVPLDLIRGFPRIKMMVQHSEDVVEALRKSSLIELSDDLTKIRRREPLAKRKAAPAVDRDKSAFVGNLDQKVTDDILFELFLQIGPVQTVVLPAGEVGHREYAFVEFKDGPLHSAETSVLHAQRVLNGISLFGRNIRVDRSGLATGDREREAEQPFYPFIPPPVIPPAPLPMALPPSASFIVPPSLAPPGWNTSPAPFVAPFQHAPQYAPLFTPPFTPPSSQAFPGIGGSPYNTLPHGTPPQPPPLGPPFPISPFGAVPQPLHGQSPPPLASYGPHITSLLPNNSSYNPYAQWRG